MPVRTTVDIPEPLHDELRHRAQQSGTSVRALIVRAIKQVYSGSQKGSPVTGPLVDRRGKLGPAFPKDDNPHDLVFPDPNVWLARRASNWVGDCYLLAFAKESDASLVTFDKGLLAHAHRRGYSAILPS